MYFLSFLLILSVVFGQDSYYGNKYENGVGLAEYSVGKGICYYQAETNNLYHANVSKHRFNNGESCGMCVQVNSTNGYAIYKIMGFFENIHENEIDNNKYKNSIQIQNATFSYIGDYGSLPNIKWQAIKCPTNLVPTNIQLYFSPLSSNRSITSVSLYTIYVQPWNHAIALRSLDIYDRIWDRWVTGKRNTTSNFFQFQSQNVFSNSLQFRVVTVLGEINNITVNSYVPGNSYTSTTQNKGIKGHGTGKDDAFPSYASALLSIFSVAFVAIISFIIIKFSPRPTNDDEEEDHKEDKATL